MLLRRQWQDNERLVFPLTALPLALIRDELDGQPFLRNRVMWMGFFFVAIIYTINGIHVNYPAFPEITLRYNISALLTTPPWNQMDYLLVFVTFAAIGFAYLLPNDLLFSLWFCFLFTRIEDVIMVLMGGTPTSIGSHNARVLTGYQAAGAYFVLIGSYLVLGRHYFADVWRTAFTRNKTLDDSTEILPYRTAILGVIGGFAGIVAWLTIAGMSPWLAASIMGIYIFFISIVMTRAVNEAGLLMTETSFLPTHLIQLASPVTNWGAQNITLTAVVNCAFVRDTRGLLLTPLMDAQKLAGELKVRNRSLLAPFIIAAVIAFVVASIAFLHSAYTVGMLNEYEYPDRNAGDLYRQAVAAITGLARPADNVARGGLALGIVVTLALVRLRTLFPWFPLHPLAYAIAPTYAMLVLWFPCLIAWIIKTPIMRYGGVVLYRRVRPFMIGMILGEFTMAMIWAVLTTKAFGLTAPDFPY